MITQLEHKNAALLYANMERSTLGTTSRLSHPLQDRTVLQHTVSRLEKSKKLTDILVFCPEKQTEQINSLLKDHSAVVIALKEQVPVAPSVQKRKWSLASWRGGLGEATLFDEQTFTAEMITAARQRDIYLALSVPSEAALLDPALLDELIDHHYQHQEDMRFTFSLAAPGLSCCAFRMDLLTDLVEAQTPIGNLLAYKPDEPRSDFINHQCTFPTKPQLSQTMRRYLADTQRGIEAIDQILTYNTTDLSSENIVTEIEQSIEKLDRFPSEIEIEINTVPSLRVPGYPHRTDQQRGPMGLSLFKKIVNDCSGFDDICITLGGLGEPLVHEDFFAMIRAAKRAGIFGINISTDAKALCGDVAKKLLDSPIDVITVSLDANSPELYKSLKGEDCFDRIVSQLESFIEKSKSVGGPFIAASMVKMRDNFEEMEAFYDRWVRLCGFAVLEGYNSLAGQIDDRAIMDMSPPSRRPCQRLSKRMTILADGNVVFCEQDFQGRHVIANVARQSIEKLWRGDPIENLRKAHNDGNYDCNLCEACKEWHR